MGYLVKSVFWLGLVYSAMPLGEDPATLALQPSLAACRTAAAQYAQGGDGAATALAGARCADGVTAAFAKSIVAQATTTGESPKAAPDTSLTDSDRAPAWVGPSRARDIRRRHRSG